MVKVSVIIPVYNVEEFLEECLNSVINQSLNDIEIICVNDGSTDNSLSILERYAKTDNRITIINKENNGLGAARNTGLEYATGDYIYFIDSDDYIELDTLKKCYTVCEEKSLDFAMFHLINFNSETRKFYHDSHYDMVKLIGTIENKIFDYTDLDGLIFEIPVSAVNKLYNKKFLDNTNAKFPEGILFEDTPFFWDIFFNAKRVYLIQEHFYCRRRHESSITGTANIKYLDILTVYNLIFEIFEKYNHFDKFKSYLFNHKIHFTYLRFNQVNNKDKIIFFNEMKKDFMKMCDKYDFEDICEYLGTENLACFKNIIDSRSSEEFILLMKKDKLQTQKELLTSKNKKLKKQIKVTKKENRLMLSSTSWKITKPLRFIKRIFK